MCGICGYVGTNQPELLKAMCDAMVHRGPDDEGFWHSGEERVGLGQRRLSIIDLTATGHQPMANENETVWISYNGEIYDFAALRESLEDLGHRFRGGSDTEVLLRLYEEEGLDLLQKINGMYALAIWDTRQRRLFIARDHAGIKPLYYWQNGEELYFASEIKALCAIPEMPREINRDVLPHVLTYLWVPGGETIMQGVRKLEPGHYLIWQDGKVTIHRWYTCCYEPDVSLNAEEWVERVDNAFAGAIERQMVSDVPLGAFLSGGADSSAIVAHMRKLHPDREIRCFTCRIPQADMKDDRFVDDFPYAKQVAEHLGVTLESFELRSDRVSLLPKMVYHLDELDADPAVFPSYLISRFAREAGITVLLSGTGGDEVFMGYRSHLALSHYHRLRRLPAPMVQIPLGIMEMVASCLMGSGSALARRLKKFQRGAASQDRLQRHLALSDWSDPEIRNCLLGQPRLQQNAVPSCFRYYDQNFEGEGVLNHHSHLLLQTFLGAHNFLYCDKSSMAASLEVRVPFVDRWFMELCATIPEQLHIRRGTTKWILKTMLERYLPASIVHRSKTGFMAPLRKWIKKDLGGLVEELLSERTITQRGLFCPDVVRTVIRSNSEGRADYSYLIYALLNIELWQQTFVDRPAEEVVL